MVIHESDAENINAVLTTFLGESGATEALLIDRSGQLLAATGANRALDTVSISALALAVSASIKSSAFTPSPLRPETFTAVSSSETA